MWRYPGAFPLPANPLDPASIYQTLGNNVAAHYADYLLFTNTLTFNDLKNAMGQFPAAQQLAMMQMLMPATWMPEQDYRNDVLYTTRLRLNLRTEITETFSFSGRLAMYKAWGDSAGVQVFNGEPTSINIDGTTVGVPNGSPCQVHVLVRKMLFSRPAANGRASPAVTSSSPAIIRSTVDFPHPEGPTRMTSSPSAISRLTSSTAGGPAAA